MHGGGHEHGAEVFTRGVQANIGMGFGVLAFSVAMGALFAVVFAVTYGRVGNVSARLLSLYVAGGMLLSLYVVPRAEVPGQPACRQPGRDDPATHAAVPADGRAVRRRCSSVRSISVGSSSARLGAWNATLAAAGAYIVAVAVVMLILPTIDETPGPLRDDAGNIVYEGFPADDLYQFRLFSLGTQVVMWATIGLVFAALASRLPRRGAAGRSTCVSEVVRLTLVSHAMTDAMAAGRFPTDEPLNAVGHRQVDASIELGVTERAYCGPEKRTRQTAELLGLHASIDNRLADLDCGRWRGDVVGGVRPADLAIWLTDPTRAPHGGESVVELIDRVRGWMDSLTTRRSRLVAVTHPSVIRAAILVALNAPPKSFWRIDIAPVSRTVMHFRGHAWTLRSSL